MKPHIKKAQHGWMACQTSEKYGKGRAIHMGFGKTAQHAFTNLQSNISLFAVRSMLKKTEKAVSYLEFLHQ